MCVILPSKVHARNFLYFSIFRREIFMSLILILFVCLFVLLIFSFPLFIHQLKNLRQLYFAIYSMNIVYFSLIYSFPFFFFLRTATKSSSAACAPAETHHRRFSRSHQRHHLIGASGAELRSEGWHASSGKTGAPHRTDESDVARRAIIWSRSVAHAVTDTSMHAASAWREHFSSKSHCAAAALEALNAAGVRKLTRWWTACNVFEYVFGDVGFTQFEGSHLWGIKVKLFVYMCECVCMCCVCSCVRACKMVGCVQCTQYVCIGDVGFMLFWKGLRSSSWCVCVWLCVCLCTSLQECVWWSCWI